MIGRADIEGSKSDVATVWAAMKAKTKIGMNLKTKKKKKSKRIFPTAKRQRPDRSTATERSRVIGRRGGGSR
ncbi:hypothetical protein ALC56_03609 [Trachymyrmex septentrionalis]|uniref:Uncharacterized protein n=1 Tax=Trachymyrmex septentrionalis TaxID=34720 RepID=A0A195FN86_9HYME|nr:hypothetical protein ALC56_03609 [Trachymyrmex septentrionalis]